jgi:hypothetical protein
MIDVLVVVRDCAYGSDLSFRSRLTGLGLLTRLGIWAKTRVRKTKGGPISPRARPNVAGA